MNNEMLMRFSGSEDIFAFIKISFVFNFTTLKYKFITKEHFMNQLSF